MCRAESDRHTGRPVRELRSINQVHTELADQIESAELILPCADFDAALEFFTGQLKFKIYTIFPADNPRVAVICGHGLRLRLEKTNTDPDTNKSIVIRLSGDFGDNVNRKKHELTAPNGVRIRFAAAHPPVFSDDFKSRLIVNRFSAGEGWTSGRAGMRYRDLISGRAGGHFIASHIHIPDGGPVPDYVHFHDIDFQMIYCYRGWARLVYEDQGEPFIFRAGDCVLQPPLIRHRVLESSDNLEVIEVSSPAEHKTYAEHEIALPTDGTNPERDFGGQKFVHHQARVAVWKQWRAAGFEYRDTGIGTATGGLAEVGVVRPQASPCKDLISHKRKFCFMFVLAGATTFESAENTENLTARDALLIPADSPYRFSTNSPDLEILEARL